MNAIIQTGGKQYNIKEGDIISIEKLSKNIGEEVIFNDILLVKKSEDNLIIGSPFIDGAQVSAKYLNEKREKKIIIFKKKRRKGYRKKQGHRQTSAQILINKITIP